MREEVRQGSEYVKGEFDIQRTEIRDIFVIYSLYIPIIKDNEMHKFSIFLTKYWKHFGHVHCPSSGESQICTHAKGICNARSVGVSQRGQEQAGIWQVPYTEVKVSGCKLGRFHCNYGIFQERQQLT